jgi:hypothetical protein
MGNSLLVHEETSVPPVLGKDEKNKGIIKKQSNGNVAFFIY